MVIHQDHAKLFPESPKVRCLVPCFSTYLSMTSDYCKSTVKLFADDAILYRNINSRNDTHILQHDILALQEWANKWQMKFSPDKCALLSFSKSKSPLEFQYKISNTVINRVTDHKYLGITLSSNLK